jgi:hypothetical protein
MGIVYTVQTRCRQRCRFRRGTAERELAVCPRHDLTVPSYQSEYLPVCPVVRTWLLLALIPSHSFHSIQGACFHVGTCSSRCEPLCFASANICEVHKYSLHVRVGRTHSKKSLQHRLLSHVHENDFPVQFSDSVRHLQQPHSCCRTCRTHLGISLGGKVSVYTITRNTI